jgi:transcriptional regulator with XRE-family HTH domain
MPTGKYPRHDRKDAFRQLKKRLGMSAPEIAELTGKSRKSVDGYAGTNRRMNPPKSVIEAMKEALRRKIDADLLFLNDVDALVVPMPPVVVDEDEVRRATFEAIFEEMFEARGATPAPRKRFGVHRRTAV